VRGGRFPKHALPVFQEAGRKYLLDIFDEAHLGLEVRSRDIEEAEVFQFHISPTKPTIEGRRLEWVENYRGDNIRERYDVRNFTEEDLIAEARSGHLA